MLAVDWSYTKGLAVYDGKKARILDRKALLRKLAGDSIPDVKSNVKLNPASLGVGGESNQGFKSTASINLPTPLVILEQGCPLSLIYDILKTGCQVSLIGQFEVKTYREAQGIEKTDKNDAMVIYEVAQGKPHLLSPVNLNNSQMRLIDLYQRYKRYQKARVAMMHMRKAYIRQFGSDGVKSTATLKSSDALNNPSSASEGEGESTFVVQSTPLLNPSPSDSTLPYDIGIDTLKAAENSCLKKIVKLAPPVPQSVKIKGLGPRIWAGIFIKANPVNFPTLSRYLRYCGLVDQKQLGTKWSRHARMLYHLLAESVMKYRDDRFRPIYDECKKDVAVSHPDYTRKHIHNAALNRTATFLAKEIYYGVRRNGN